MELLSLVGEQPTPNLLIARALSVNSNILCYTETTAKVAGNLTNLLNETEIYPVEPYRIDQAVEQITALVGEGTVMNLTGGTKPMALAAYEVARSLSLPVVYLQSEGSASTLYQYDWQAGRLKLTSRQTLEALITIQDYLEAHGLQPTSENALQNPQESGLRRWLEGQVDECRNNLVFEALEIDFILRRNNQVAIMEAKMTEKNSRKGIDQLNTAGGRAYLGTYTKKIWVVNKPLGSQLSHLAEARQIDVVVIQGSLDPRTGRQLLSPKSKTDLSKALDRALGKAIR